MRYNFNVRGLIGKGIRGGTKEMANEMNLSKLEKNRKYNEKILRTYCQRAWQAGIAADLKILPRFSEGELIRRREMNRHVRAYMAQIMNNMMEDMESCDCAFAIVDPDGCVIRLKGPAPVLQWLGEKGITLGVAWKMGRLGPNAITIGLENQHGGVSVGEENYQKILSDMAIYYSPMQTNYQGTVEDFGGIAIFTRKENAHPAYLMTAASMAHNFMIRMAMAWRTCDAYEADTKGMALLDYNLRNGIISITHHNKSFFDILGLPRESKRDVYFKNVEYYFDPLPMNKKFWSMLQENQPVKEEDITLYVQGKPKDVIISLSPVGNPNLLSDGMILYLTSRKQQAKQVADKTGNNAVITFDDIIGQSAAMKSRIRRAKLLANTDGNIMLMGESGVGKDVFAQAIHNQSARAKEPFVAVNCGAIPRDLIASELFGYDGGAFTGAKKQGNIGKFELANGGTLFLDEIGEMPLDIQATLLRAVEQKQFSRLGSNKVIHADVKIISATNVDINKMIQEKKFRSDLYYRLCTMSVYIPPLREREDDVILLAEHFVESISRKIGRTDRMTFSEEAKEFLRKCRWDGNVRELQNVIECMVQLYADPEITVEMIQENINPAYFYGQAAVYGQQEEAAKEEKVVPEMIVHPYGNARAYLTREEILDALEKNGGNRSRAADYLGVGRRTLYRYIEKLDIGKK